MYQLHWLMSISLSFRLTRHTTVEVLVVAEVVPVLLMVLNGILQDLGTDVISVQMTHKLPKTNQKSNESNRIKDEMISK